MLCWPRRGEADSNVVFGLRPKFSSNWERQFVVSDTALHSMLFSTDRFRRNFVTVSFAAFDKNGRFLSRRKGLLNPGPLRSRGETDRRPHLYHLSHSEKKFLRHTEEQAQWYQRTHLDQPQQCPIPARRQATYSHQVTSSRWHWQFDEHKADQ